MNDIPYADRPYRPCVGIFLLNADNMLFAGRRIDNRAEAWQMPQGGIDHGEEIRAALTREIEEEIGVEVTSVDGPVAVSSGLLYGIQRMNIYFLVETVGDFSFKEEISETKWVSEEEFKQLKVCSALSEDKEALTQKLFSLI